MVVGLIGLILSSGLGFFWPARRDADHAQGREGPDRPPGGAEGIPGKPGDHRIKIKVGNRDLYGADFVWADEGEHRDARLSARRRRHRSHGVGHLDRHHRRGEGRRPGGGPGIRGGRGRAGATACPRRSSSDGKSRRIEKSEIGGINHEQEQIRLRLRKLQLKGEHRRRARRSPARRDGADSGPLRAGRVAPGRAQEGPDPESRRGRDDGKDKELPFAQIVDVYSPTGWALLAKSGHYLTGLWHFVSDDPRESNTEGGVFPAIFGTVMMVFIMSIIVTPLGVLAAFYLREYARAGYIREHRAHRRQQPGRGAVDRLRGLRRGLLHLPDRREHRPALLRRGACPRRPSGQAASCGPR